MIGIHEHLISLCWSAKLVVSCTIEQKSNGIPVFGGTIEIFPEIRLPICEDEFALLVAEKWVLLFVDG